MRKSWKTSNSFFSYYKIISIVWYLLLINLFIGSTGDPERLLGCAIFLDFSVWFRDKFERTPSSDVSASRSIKNEMSEIAQNGYFYLPDVSYLTKLAKTSEVWFFTESVSAERLLRSIPFQICLPYLYRVSQLKISLQNSIYEIRLTEQPFLPRFENDQLEN